VRAVAPERAGGGGKVNGRGFHEKDHSKKGVWHRTFRRTPRLDQPFMPHPRPKVSP
jgi:hypothetical protein